MASNASSWYSISGHSARKYRAYVNAYVQSETDTTATIYVEGCVQAYYLSSYGAGVAVYINGQWVDSASVAIYNSSGEAGNWGWASGTLTIDKGSSGKSITCSCSVWGETVSGCGGLNGGSPSTSVAVPVSAITYYAPNAPTALNNVRESDNKNQLYWTAPSTSTTKPVSAILIERSVDGGAWSQIASVSGSATSYNDTSTTADHSYQYRIRSQNSAGYSDYVESQVSYNTPSAPTKVTASRLAENTVKLEIENPANTAQGAEINRSEDGSTWEWVANVQGAPVTETTDEPGGGTFYYRVRNTRDGQDGGTLVSAWSPTSNAVVTICAPAAPTLLTPTSGRVVSKAEETVIFAWAHNPIDGSAQTAAKLRYSVDAGATWTEIEIEGSATSYEFDNAFDVNAQVTWGVCTKGTHEDYGPWSDNRVFYVCQMPSAAFAQPADGFTVENMPIAVELQYDDASGTLANATLSVSDGYKTVYTRNMGTETTCEIQATEWLPEGGETYTLTVTVRSSSSLTATATREIAVSFVPPKPALLHIENDVERGYATFVVSVAEQLGKNILPNYYSFASAESNGVSLVVADDFTMQLLGTNTSDDWVTFNSLSPSEDDRLVLSAGTYTASPYITLATSDGNKSGTFTVESFAEVYNAYIAVAPQTSVSEAVYPQVEVGEYGTDYEPYQEPLVEPVALSVYRVHDGEQVLLGEGLQAGAGVVDKYAPLNCDYQYIAVTHAESGAINSQVYPNKVRSIKWFLYHDEGVASAVYNPESDIKLSRPGKKQVHYAGRRWPVSFDGYNVSDERSLSASLFTYDDMEAFRALMYSGGRCVFKSYDGDVFHADVDVSLKPDFTTPNLYGTVTLNITRIDGGDL